MKFSRNCGAMSGVGNDAGMERWRRLAPCSREPGEKSANSGGYCIPVASADPQVWLNFPVPATLKARHHT
ncbi:MAG: hypothetical protein GX826_07235 [Gammaproteobacteria bacterium]|nr:hypothetical protein [Gammaproteobacteria bacterium]